MSSSFETPFRLILRRERSDRLEGEAKGLLRMRGPRMVDPIRVAGVGAFC